MSTLSRTMPIDWAEVKRRREAVYTLQEAADRATTALKQSGYGSTFTPQRWHDLESGRYQDPRFSAIEAVCAALECTIDDIRIGHDKRPTKVTRRRA